MERRRNPALAWSTFVRPRHHHTSQLAKLGNNKNPMIKAAVPKPAQGSAVPFGPTRASTNAVKSRITEQGNRPKTKKASALVAGVWRGRGRPTDIENNNGAMTVYDLNGNSTNPNTVYY